MNVAGMKASKLYPCHRCIFGVCFYFYTEVQLQGLTTQTVHAGLTQTKPVQVQLTVLVLISPSRKGMELKPQRYRNDDNPVMEHNKIWPSTYVAYCGRSYM